MLRKWFKKCLPTHEEIEKKSHFTWLKTQLHHKNLWQFTCQSVARGVAIGLFVAFLPLPGQMILAALFSIFLQANIPLAVLMTWVSNPLTFVPLNYLIYALGGWVLHEKPKNITMPTFNWEWNDIHIFWSSLIKWLSRFTKAYLVGLPILAISVSILGYVIVILSWKLFAIYHKK